MVDLSKSEFKDLKFLRPYLKSNGSKKHERLFESIYRQIYPIVKRKKKRVHKKSILSSIEMLIVNLYSAHHVHKCKYLAVSRTKNDYDSSNRYTNPNVGYASVILVLGKVHNTSREASVDNNPFNLPIEHE